MTNEIHPGLAVLREYIPDDNLRRDFIRDAIEADIVTAGAKDFVDFLMRKDYNQIFWPDGMKRLPDDEVVSTLKALKSIHEFIRSL